MDNIYQSIKAFLKSFLNLFLAVVDLITSLINGLASLVVRLRPRISEKYVELKREREEGGRTESKFMDEKTAPGTAGKVTTSGKHGYHLDFKEYDAAAIEKLRAELEEELTSKDKYYYLNASVTGSGTGFYAIILSVWAFTLAALVMLFNVVSYNEVKVLFALVMAAACIVVCIIINRYRKREMKNRLIKQMLDMEFADKIWEKTAEENIGAEAEQMEIA